MTDSKHPAVRLREQYQRRRFESLYGERAPGDGPVETNGPPCECGLNEGTGCADPSAPNCRMAEA